MERGVTRPLHALLGAVPGAEQRQADFAVVVQVGVEAHTGVAGGQELDQRWHVGILARKEDVKEKAAIGVGRVNRARHQRADDIHAVLVLQKRQRS